MHILQLKRETSNGKREIGKRWIKGLDLEFKPEEIDCNGCMSNKASRSDSIEPPANRSEKASWKTFTARRIAKQVMNSADAPMVRNTDS